MGLNPCQEGLRCIISHGKGQCLSEANKVLVIYKSTGSSKRIYKG